MKKPRHSPRERHPVGTPSNKRFRRILEIRFAGNQSAMALALGVSQSMLSRVVSGKKAPGPRLLMALSRCPGVNAHWALSGEGEEAQRDDPGAVADNQRLPLVREVLPGPPLKCRELQTGATFPVFADYYSPSRYWLELETKNPLVQGDESGMRSGDLILLDADPRIWRRRPQILNDRICGVQFEHASSSRLKLCRVRCEQGESGPEHRIWVRTMGTETTESGAQKKTSAERAPINFRRGSEKKAMPGDQLQRGRLAGAAELEIEDVVALAIMMIRRL
jgi:transcriptional regulator with XRE-family HTH domain